MQAKWVLVVRCVIWKVSHPQNIYVPLFCFLSLAILMLRDSGGFRQEQGPGQSATYQSFFKN